MSELTAEQIAELIEEHARHFFEEDQNTGVDGVDYTALKNSTKSKIMEAFAALKQRAEDAELIAWGLARVARQEWDYDTDLVRFTILYDGDDRWYANGDWSGKTLSVYDLPPGRYPTKLTPSAREALRKAQEAGR